jgi:hypothetical protein
LNVDLSDILMRDGEKCIEQAQLVHQFERRGVDGVAAKIAKEVGMLLEYDDIDARAREQEAQHHAGRPTAGDATARRKRRHAQPAIFLRWERAMALLLWPAAV